MMKHSKKNMVLISFMLFSLFFGAGNLIFPPLLGQQAGTNIVWVFIGFLITAVVLPILGVVVVGKYGGLTVLAGKVGKTFALIFTILIYLSIGPGLGIPRAGSVPFEMAILPYLPKETNFSLWMLLYTFVFFTIVSMNFPSSTLKRLISLVLPGVRLVFAKFF